MKVWARLLVFNCSGLPNSILLNMVEWIQGYSSNSFIFSPCHTEKLSQEGEKRGEWQLAAGNFYYYYPELNFSLPILLGYVSLTCHKDSMKRVENYWTGCSLRSFLALTFSESCSYFSFFFVSFHLTPFHMRVPKNPHGSLCLRHYAQFHLAVSHFSVSG